MVKGHPHWIFLDNGPFASKRVPVFKFWLGAGLLVLLWVAGAEMRFWFPVQLEINVRSSVRSSAAWSPILVCCFWKSTRYLIRQDRTILSWFCDDNIRYLLSGITLYCDYSQKQKSQLPSAIRIYLSHVCDSTELVLLVLAVLAHMFSALQGYWCGLQHLGQLCLLLQMWRAHWDGSLPHMFLPRVFWSDHRNSLWVNGTDTKV